VADDNDNEVDGAAGDGDADGITGDDNDGRQRW
jgi:hypothetical protein